MPTISRDEVAHLARLARLAVTEEECRDVIWSMSDGTLWYRFVIERGWDGDRFSEWLGRTWVYLLVRQRRSRPSARRS